MRLVSLWQLLQGKELLYKQKRHGKITAKLLVTLDQAQKKLEVMQKKLQKIFKHIPLELMNLIFNKRQQIQILILIVVVEVVEAILDHLRQKCLKRLRLTKEYLTLQKRLGKQSKMLIGNL